MKTPIFDQNVEKRIRLIRGEKVILDVDLAELYGVETKYLKRQVKRNIRRFPEDFMLQLTKEEILRCQIVTSSHGGSRYQPFAFTEQGVSMLSSVLNSEKSILVNILIMRAFVRLRHLLNKHKEIEQKLVELERNSKKHDIEIGSIFETLRKLLYFPEKNKTKIGFFPQK